MDVFDAIGETVDVLTGSEPQIEPPTVERAFETHPVKAPGLLAPGLLAESWRPRASARRFPELSNSLWKVADGPSARRGSLLAVPDAGDGNRFDAVDWAEAVAGAVASTAGVLACKFARRLAARTDGWIPDAPPVTAEDDCGSGVRAARGCALELRRPGSFGQSSVRAGRYRWCGARAAPRTVSSCAVLPTTIRLGEHGGTKFRLLHATAIVAAHSGSYGVGKRHLIAVPGIGLKSSPAGITQTVFEFRNVGDSRLRRHGKGKGPRHH